MLQFEYNNGLLTVFIDGRIDSNNAPTLELEIFDYIKDKNISKIILDADKLTMISSAGLRVILRIRKEIKDISIINVIPDVYEVFEMTGFIEMMDIKKGYRKISVEGKEIIGEGASGIVYRYDPETVVKVYKIKDALKAIENERFLARKAFISGIPTAIPFDIVKVNDSYGSVFELLDIKTITSLIIKNPDKIDEYIVKYTSLMKKMHSTYVDVNGLVNAKTFTLDYINNLKTYLDDETYENLYLLVSNVPATTNLIHGDYQTSNVVMQKDDVLLIDMEFLSYGHPIFELGQIVSAYVCFNDLDHDNIFKFFGYDVNVSSYIWRETLRYYFSTDDKDFLNEIEHKALVIGYCRILRFFVLYKDLSDQYSKDMIAHCSKRIKELIKDLDNLYF